MEPVNFDGVNAVYGKDQKEYLPLPAERRGKPQYGEVLTCWQLSPEELEQVQKTGKIWLSLLTFNRPLQPVILSTEKPETYCPND